MYLKANQAFLHGAVGLILYSDPADYALDNENRVYPDTWFLPGTGIQRGNVVTVKGDPLTQGYPAKGDYCNNLKVHDLYTQAHTIPFLA